MILGHGIDLTQISRIKKALEAESGAHFEKRVFSSGEIAYCRSCKDPYPHFAARFAAKEAYGKALGMGLGPSGNFTEIEVVRLESGAPEMRLSGRALEVFEAKGGRKIFVSLAHDGDYAQASVIVAND